MNPCTLSLPRTVGVWKRPDTPRIIDSSTIFDYMNGGGELYLAYRFNHMRVYKYTAEKEPHIVVEIYCMNDADDAFGLLSLDWGGDPVELGGTPPGEPLRAVASTNRALYGRGLLRIASDNIYARIIASRETPQSRKAVVALGRAVVAGRKNPPEPKILRVLPTTISPGWHLLTGDVGFFRSHMVLNLLYYLSHRNILNLDHSVDAVTAPYERANGTQERKRVQVLVAKYAEEGGERKAFERFRDAYLPDRRGDTETAGKTDDEGYHEIEDGWLGYRIGNRALVLVFSCPDRDSAHTVVNGIRFKAIAGK